MAKTRMLKPDLRRSLKVASWPREVRYFWVLLWGYVDDHGKGVDSALLVKADCFPLDPDITGDTIDEWLWVIANSGVIARYTVEGIGYLAVINWKEHQKPPHPTVDVLPSFSDPRAVRRELHASFMHDAGSLHASLTPVLGLGLGLGLGCIGSSPAATDIPKPDLEALFNDAYSHWPKKVERKAALEQFKAKVKKRGPAELARDIALFGAAYAATTPRQFTPALGVWIGHERWTDDLPTAPEMESRNATRGDQNIAFVANLARQQSEPRGIEA